MNASIRRVASSWVVLLGGAALLVAQQAQPPAQPGIAQPRVQPEQTVQQRLGAQGQVAQPGQTNPPGQAVQPRQPGQIGQSGQIGGRPGGLLAQQIEPSIVTLLIIDNNKEIALAQLGQQTSQNEQVKQFCEMLVRDHSNFVEKLQERAATGAGRPQRFGAAPGAQGLDATDQSAPPRTAAQPGAAATERDANVQPRNEATAAQDRNQRNLGQELRAAAGQRGQTIMVAKPVIPNQPGSELLQLYHELAEKCLDSARKDAEKHGAQFDQHFLGAQIMGHKAMLDKLQVFQNHVTPQTKQLLASAQETTRKHLEEAMNLHERLSKEGGRDDSDAKRRTEERRDRE